MKIITGVILKCDIHGHQNELAYIEIMLGKDFDGKYCMECWAEQLIKYCKKLKEERK